MIGGFACHRLALALLICKMGAVAIFAAAFPSVEELPVQRELPNPLILSNGQPVTTRAQWSTHRTEMKAVLEYYALGHSPPPPGNVTGHELLSQSVSALVTGRLVRLTFGPDSKLSFDLALLIPTDNPRPIPVIIQPVFTPFSASLQAATNHPWQKLADGYALPLARGYAIAIFYYQQCGLDSTNYQQSPIFAAYPGYDWGDLAAWAWGMSRCVDYLETQAFADNTKFIALGHSRLGKAALIAGAFDDRFSLTAPAGSGCAGTGAYRFNGKNRGGKEGLEDAVRHFPQWLSPHLAGFSNQVERLPFDQHWLLALIAPRAVIAADGQSDPYANGNALAQSYFAAKPVFDFLGVPQQLGVNFRPGKHLLAPADWQAILDFADERLRGRELHRRFDQLPPANELH